MKPNPIIHNIVIHTVYNLLKEGFICILQKKNHPGIYVVFIAFKLAVVGRQMTSAIQPPSHHRN